MPPTSFMLSGLIAATFTPLHQNGSVHFEGVQPMVDFLVTQGVGGLYVLGSTGEGPSMTFEERRGVAEAFVRAAAGRVAVIVQVGSESLQQARLLAAHAQAIGAQAISSVSPVYFKPNSLATLVASMAEVAAGAPRLPFYYYHIPAVTGVGFSMLDFLKLGEEQIPTLRGIKFTSPDILEFQSCVESAREQFQILWGSDEMLLCGLTAGATAAVGSTYNFAAPIYHRLLSAWTRGDIAEAQHQQSRSQALVRTFLPYGARAAQKAIMSMVSGDCGPSRLPIAPLSPDQFERLYEELLGIGFFKWLQLEPD